MKYPSLYENILHGADDASQEEIIEYLMEELPYAWPDEYKNNCIQPGDICTTRVSSFEYIFDDRTAFQVYFHHRLAGKKKFYLPACLYVSSHCNATFFLCITTSCYHFP